MSRIYSLVVLAITLAVTPVAFGQRPDRYHLPRQKMVVDYIEAEGVKSPKVLAQMRKVPRHEFVSADVRHLAYRDHAVDIGHKQTMSAPFTVGYMTETIDPQPTDKVLEIGTGSGYQAAVLSGLVQEVYSIEIVEPLGKRAGVVLKRLGYKNVHTRIGDGYLGWPEQAPFDKIIVTCSPEDVPAPLVEQLKEGGKMLIPVGALYQQVFHLLEKKDGKLVETKLIPTLFVPMTGKMEELRNHIPDPAQPEIVNGDFEQAADDEGVVPGWHFPRGISLVPDAFEGETAVRFENDDPGRVTRLLQAFPVDGVKVPYLKLSWAMKSKGIHEGNGPAELPGIYVYCVDAKRQVIERITIGPWEDDVESWKSNSRLIRIPQGAKEAVMQVGLNGATGTLWIDDIRLEVAN
ncbi:protein-L-isoaspartate(D-aspartate) O-methyltransferase [Planctomicrobium sp. SH668]|uniref:protein-L-isoaspartate(D-aspartate) O-methyltransferase n=1 Tax=Planctomicrobium sp. SH668 TaxID=3448126 RepID=UPI003F5C51B5